MRTARITRRWKRSWLSCVRRDAQARRASRRARSVRPARRHGDRRCPMQQHVGDPGLHGVEVEARGVDVVAASGSLVFDAVVPGGVLVGAGVGPRGGERGALRGGDHEAVGGAVGEEGGWGVGVEVGGDGRGGHFGGVAAVDLGGGAGVGRGPFLGGGARRATWVTGQSRKAVMRPGAQPPASPKVVKSLMPTKSRTPCTRGDTASRSAGRVRATKAPGAAAARAARWPPAEALARRTWSGSRFHVPAWALTKRMARSTSVSGTGKLLRKVPSAAVVTRR